MTSIASTSTPTSIAPENHPLLCLTGVRGVRQLEQEVVLLKDAGLLTERWNSRNYHTPACAVATLSVSWANAAEVANMRAAALIAACRKIRISMMAGLPYSAALYSNLRSAMARTYTYKPCLIFFAPTPVGCIHDGWRGRFTKLEYLILNQDFPLPAVLT